MNISYFPRMRMQGRITLILVVMTLTIVISPCLGVQSSLKVPSGGKINYTISEELPHLHSDGRNIRDNFNRIIFLRGVNKGTLIWSKTGSRWVEEDWVTLQNWGCNSIRIPFNGKWALSDPDYLDLLEKTVNWGHKHKIYTILVCFWREEGVDYTGPFNEPFPPEPKEDWILMWKTIAEKFKGNTGVIYDLFNEPWGSKATSENLKSVFQECVDAIRKIDNDVLIGVSTSWSAKYWWVRDLGPLIGGNIVYTTHWYLEDGSPPEDMTMEKIFERWRNHGLEYIRDRYPVLLTEFGHKGTEQEPWFRKIIECMHDWEWGYNCWQFKGDIPENGWYKIVKSDWITPNWAGKILNEYLK